MTPKIYLKWTGRHQQITRTEMLCFAITLFHITIDTKLAACLTKAMIHWKMMQRQLALLPHYKQILLRPDMTKFLILCSMLQSNLNLCHPSPIFVTRTLVPSLTASNFLVVLMFIWDCCLITSITLKLQQWLVILMEPKTKYSPKKIEIPKY